MSKQQKQYNEAVDMERNNIDIIELLDEAYDIERLELEMIALHNQLIERNIAIRERLINQIIEHGQTV